MKTEDIFENMLERVIPTLGDVTAYGKQYHIGYVKALKDLDVITDREYLILNSLVCHKVNIVVEEEHINENGY